MNISNESIIEHINKTKEKIEKGDTITLDEDERKQLISLLMKICGEVDEEEGFVFLF